MEPDDLYGLPLDRFVAERGALAKALRADGRRDEASRVAALRKPSVAAWAVNQLARTQRPAMRELLAAGDELRDTQEALLGGKGDARALRAAGERERAAVDELVDAARGVLTSGGQEPSESTVERVAETLHAAALEPDAREAVREGRLDRELRHVGLGFGDGDAPAPAAAPRRGRTQRAEPEAPRAERERAAAERAEAEAEAERERAAERKAARADERAARRRVEQAARALRTAEERRDRAARALAEADDALAAAREEAGAAETEHEAAQAGVERAQ